MSNYTQLQGFYDLRNWNIPKNDFPKLWNIQKFLFKCEQDRRKGKYKHNPLELNKIKEASANYQRLLFSYPNIGGYE